MSIPENREIVQKLFFEQQWSPEQIANRLKKGDYEKISVKLDSSMIMKGEKLTNQAFHPCFIYNSYC